MITLVLDARKERDVRRAGELLRDGKLVAFPTETVYGLGARADDERAVEELYRVKKRPPEKKPAILIPSLEDCARYAAPLSAPAALLAAAFWPGPLTLVVPDGRGGDVGLRCPDCDATRRMLKAARVPVLAPSANMSGKPPATSAQEVLAVFEGLITAVLDGGPAPLRKSSTVVRVLGNEVAIIRAGALSEEQIRAALRQ